MTVIMSQTQTAAVTTRHRTGLQLFRFILQPIAVDKLSGNCAKPITWSRGHKSRFKKKQAELVCLVRTVWTLPSGSTIAVKNYPLVKKIDIHTMNGQGTTALKAVRYCVNCGTKRGQLAFYVIFSKMRQAKLACR